MDFRLCSESFCCASLINFPIRWSIEFRIENDDIDMSLIIFSLFLSPNLDYRTCQYKLVSKGQSKIICFLVKCSWLQIWIVFLYHIIKSVCPSILTHGDFTQILRFFTIMGERMLNMSRFICHRRFLGYLGRFPRFPSIIPHDFNKIKFRVFLVFSLYFRPVEEVSENPLIVESEIDCEVGGARSAGGRGYRDNRFLQR